MHFATGKSFEIFGFLTTKIDRMYMNTIIRPESRNDNKSYKIKNNNNNMNNNNNSNNRLTVHSSLKNTYTLNAKLHGIEKAFKHIINNNRQWSENIYHTFVHI